MAAPLVVLVKVAPSRAIAEIVAQTSSLVRLEHPVRRLADVLDACGGAWALHFGDVGAWLDDLAGLLDAAGRPLPPGGGPLALRSRGGALHLRTAECVDGPPP